eukprot:2245232-Prymnesium_polylepis.1
MPVHPPAFRRRRHRPRRAPPSVWRRHSPPRVASQTQPASRTRPVARPPRCCRASPLLRAPLGPFLARGTKGPSRASYTRPFGRSRTSPCARWAPRDPQCAVRVCRRDATAAPAAAAHSDRRPRRHLRRHPTGAPSWRLRPSSCSLSRAWRSGP